MGTHNITAKYLGDATYNISTSAARSQKITKVNPTAVALASSTATPAASTAFTLTATVTTPATTSATGTMNFRNASNASLSGCGAVNLTGTGTTKTATCSVTETTAGTKSYTARYSGDTNFNTLTSAAQSVTVKAPSTTVLNTLTPAGAIAYATSRTYSGTVTPAAATGSVQVLAGTTVICTATLTGTTTKTFTCVSTLIPDAGAYSITAKYLGDTATNGSTSAAQSQTISKINPTTVALASSTATPALNAAFTLTATITSPATTTATGTVNFRNATNASLANCAAATLTGTGITKTATCSATETSAGTKTYNALYSGDTNFNAGANPSASVTLTAPDVATTTTVTASATTLNYPNSPTLTATVAASASTVTGGTVTFKRLSVDVPSCVNLPLTTAGANKIATCSPANTSLPVGAHTFTAHYGGVAGFAASSGGSPAITINDPPPANNNVGNNSEANPVLVDAFYVHPDHLGTPRVVTNPTDNKRVWEWESTPFGESAANENPQNVTGAGLPAAQFRFNLRFPGQVYDAETGKHYNYFRDYDSSTGRYVESDPIGLRGGVSTFGYVDQSPLRAIDPRGQAVTYSGNISTFGATVGIGGQLAFFNFKSECKCDKQVSVEGFASFVTLGAGASVKGVGSFLKEASGASSSITMVDRFANCPDPSCANGSAWTSGVNSVLGAGGSILVRWMLGRLNMYAMFDGPAYGFDISATSTLFGWSAVTKSETKCCTK